MIQFKNISIKSEFMIAQQKLFLFQALFVFDQLAPTFIRSTKNKL
jgi:hypothetical protein